MGLDIEALIMIAPRAPLSGVKRCGIDATHQPNGDQRLAVHKCRPDALRVPNRLHLNARLGLVHAEYVAAISTQEGRDAVVRNAMDVHGDILDTLHDRAEL